METERQQHVPHGQLQVDVRGHPRGKNVLAAVVRILEWIEEDKARDRVTTGEPPDARTM